MIEPAPGTGDARRGVRSAVETGPFEGSAAACTDATSALGVLVATLDRACDELFSAVPFPGDQATGASVNAHIDELVGALRGLRTEADDLRRVVAISARLSRGGP